MCKLLSLLLILASSCFVMYASDDNATDAPAFKSISDILIHPMVVNSFGLENGNLSSTLEAGIGARLFKSSQSRLLFIATASVFRSADSVLIASLLTKATFELRLIGAVDQASILWCNAINAGYISMTPNRILQLLSGMKLEIPLGSIEWRKALPANLLILGGFGYDFRHQLSREILNVGFAIEDLIYISIDCVSLWKDMNPIINVGRF